jgi:hypothetical protein
MAFSPIAFFFSAALVDYGDYFEVSLGGVADLHGLPSHLTGMVGRNQNSCFEIKVWSG